MKSLSLLLALTMAAVAADVPWQVRIQIIEACSCDLFCPCYFIKRATHKHTGSTVCDLNTAGRVESGKYGNVDLAGRKFWKAASFDTDRAKNLAPWRVVTFEPQITGEQKDGLRTVLSKIYPATTTSEVDTSEITWVVSPDGKTAHAKLGNGKGEIQLRRFAGADPNRTSQISNLRYSRGADWNSPFDLYFSDHYYKGFGKSFELKEANGYMLTLEVSSDGKRIPAAPKKSD